MSGVRSSRVAFYIKNNKTIFFFFFEKLTWKGQKERNRNFQKEKRTKNKEQ